MFYEIEFQGFHINLTTKIQLQLHGRRLVISPRTLHFLKVAFEPLCIKTDSYTFYLPGSFVEYS